MSTIRVGKHTLAWLKRVSSAQNVRCPECDTFVGGMYDKLYLAVAGQCAACSPEEEFDRIADKLIQYLCEVGGW